MLQTLPAVPRALQFGLRHRVRGASRITLFLSRHLSSLQSVPVPVGRGEVYLDLRREFSHRFLAAAPCPANMFEPATMDAFAALVRPGDVFFDIGANYGWFSLLAASLGAADIYAFEPQPDIAELLQKTVAPFGGHVHNCALSDEEGEADLFVPSYQEMAGLRDWVTSSDKAMDVRRIRCVTHCLDELGLPHPDFVKVDVEGAERLVFEGARKILDRGDAPVVLFEASARSAAAFGLDRYAARDFLLSLRAPDWTIRYLRRDGGGWQSSPPERGHIGTVLALPRSRIDRLPSQMPPPARPTEASQ